ncbi:MAG: hypothetical protein R2742_03655 [Micropruina glycogenica]
MGRLDYVLSDDDYVAFNTDVYRYSPGFVAASRAQRNLLCLVVPLAIVCIGSPAGLPAAGSGGRRPRGSRCAVVAVAQVGDGVGSVATQAGQRPACSAAPAPSPSPAWDDQRVYETFHDMGCYVD